MLRSLFVALILLAFIATLARLIYFFARRQSARDESTKHYLSKLPADSQAAFIVCVFSMLAKLAQADGVVSDAETAKIKEYIDSKLRLNRKTKAMALRVFKEALDSPLNLRDYADRFIQSYPDRVQLHDNIIETLVEVSVADGVLSEKEDELIRAAALRLDLTEAAYQRIKFRHITPQNLVH